MPKLNFPRIFIDEATTKFNMIIIYSVCWFVPTFTNSMWEHASLFITSVINHCSLPQKPSLPRE